MRQATMLEPGPIATRPDLVPSLCSHALSDAEPGTPSAERALDGGGGQKPSGEPPEPGPPEEDPPPDPPAPHPPEPIPATP